MINICFCLCIFYTQLCISQSLLLKLFTDFLIYIYFFQIFIYLHIVWNEMTLFAQWCNQNNPQQAKPCCLFLSSRVVSCNQIKVRMVWVYAMSGNIKVQIGWPVTQELPSRSLVKGAVRDSLWCSRAQKANFVTSVRRRSGIRKDSIPQSERCHANMQKYRSDITLWVAFAVLFLLESLGLSSQGRRIPQRLKRSTTINGSQVSHQLLLGQTAPQWVL